MLCVNVLHATSMKELFTHLMPLSIVISNTALGQMKNDQTASFIQVNCVNRRNVQSDWT